MDNLPILQQYALKSMKLTLRVGGDWSLEWNFKLQAGIVVQNVHKDTSQ